MLSHIKLYLYKRSLRNQLKSLIHSGKIDKITFVSETGEKLVCYKIDKKSNEGEKK